MDFYNKVVVITGASSGIGASTATLFANHSAKLVLIGRNLTRLEDVAEKCEAAKGIKPLTIQADVANDDDVKKIVDSTIENFGGIDVLINSAGFAACGYLSDGIEPYDRVMATNVRAIYQLTSLFAPHLIKSKGNIVNVSSISAFKPVRGLNFMPYCVSKAALDQFTKCCAMELAKEGVRVNSVNPGGTKTAFVEVAGLTDNSEELFKVRGKSYPLGKAAESEEVADLIMYLASDRAKSITGSIMVVDNGEQWA